jgi:hypothetical protein
LAPTFSSEVGAVTIERVESNLRILERAVHFGCIVEEPAHFSPYDRTSYERSRPARRTQAF